MVSNQERCLIQGQEALIVVQSLYMCLRKYKEGCNQKSRNDVGLKNNQTYEATIASSDRHFTKKVELSKVYKPGLMQVDNPKYEELLKKYINH